MATVRYRDLRGAACLTVLALAACAQQGQDEMSWARAASARTAGMEGVAADPRSRTFTVRVKDTGELRMMRADELIAGPALPAKAPAAAAAADTAAPAATAPVSAEDGPVASAGEAAVPQNVSAPPAAPAGTPADTTGGRVLEAGPGYSIKAASPAARAAGGGRGRRGLDRCLGWRAGVCRILALQGPESPARHRGVPRSRGQRLELTAGARDQPPKSRSP